MEKKKILLRSVSMDRSPLELRHWEDYAGICPRTDETFRTVSGRLFSTDQTTALLQEVQTKCNELLLLTTKLPAAGVNDACNGNNATGKRPPRQKSFRKNRQAYPQIRPFLTTLIYNRPVGASDRRRR